MHRRSKRISLFVGLAVCVATGLSWADAEWPGFRGPNFDGTLPGVRLFEGEKAALTLGWKRALGSGYSAIAVGDGRVVTMFADGDADVMAAFDPVSGDELWRYRISDTYVGHDGSHGGPISTPLIAGGRIYGLGAWGHLFAVDASTGKQVWATHLVDDLGSTKPHYGFTTSPLLADGVLVLEIGGEDGKMIGGFDPDTGELKWTAGDDKIEYHSPIVATIGGVRQVVAAGKDNAYGIEAATGKVLWSYQHAGDERAMGGFTIVPVPAGEDRLFLMNKIDSSVMLSVKKNEGGYEIEELWSNGAIKSSYVVPVYHDGYVYGMSNRIFTCLDAATGEIRWRSREPGDGFPTIVGDHLVILTKPGSLHVAEASPDGYHELARLDLFDANSWSEVSFAGGALYARSMSDLARVDLSSAASQLADGEPWIEDTELGRFLAEFEQAGDKNAAIEAFLARHDSMPIVESTGAVHFVYRGEAEDVGIVGDMIGYRREDPMTRLDGTDLFYYSTRLEPDAAVTYGFIPDYGEPVADPNNAQQGEGLFGEVSWFAMPAWRTPFYLDEAPDARHGRLETLEWVSQVREGQKRKAQVYLPAGYDDADARRYPVLYVHNGQEALDQGGMKNALDHLIGSTVDPVIAVFVLADEENPRRDLGDGETYSKMIVDELIPRVDERFRTIDDPRGRATVGAGRGANAALVSAFQHPDVFGRVGAQSATMGADEMQEMTASAADRPMVVYLEWGTYHLRSPHEGWDLVEENRKLWTQLREAGYRPAGGEVPEGYGWACWRGHTDELLAALYPMRE